MTEQKRVFQKILVATDFSDCASAALSQAVWLAKLVGAEITVMHVVPLTTETMATFSTNPWYVAANAEDIEQRLRQGIERRLQEAISPHRSSGVKLACKTLWGAPFVEIIQAVEEEGFDLVVVGTRGLSAVSRFLIGSTAAKLARKCPCPVWIVKQQPKHKVATILAPVDFSVLSRKSLQLAARLAARTDCSLHALHVYSEHDAYPLDLLTPNDDIDVAATRRLQRRHALEQLRGFVAESLLPIEPTLHVERGEPWKRVLSTANRIEADLTVLGAVGRSGVAGLLIGNTAEKILYSSECSLLAVKSDGFVSPVRPKSAMLHV
jgi:nucleotide-binding universal stress UspA family protein